jgi:hypothetical protein
MFLPVLAAVALPELRRVASVSLAALFSSGAAAVMAAAVVTVPAAAAAVPPGLSKSRDGGGHHAIMFKPIRRGKSRPPLERELLGGDTATPGNAARAAALVSKSPRNGGVNLSYGANCPEHDRFKWEQESSRFLFTKRSLPLRLDMTCPKPIRL